MKQQTFSELVDRGASAEKLTEWIVHELAIFNLGNTVDFNFLSRQSVGDYCRALGFSPNRNWAKLTLDKIAPKSKFGPNVALEKEATAVLAQLKFCLDRHLLVPKEKDEPQPDIISDFLPKGAKYKRAPTLGHLWEFQYALAVELEHGKTRGANVTNNHPLLTALVVVAHLSEDKVYYARLWEMETAAELFNANLEGSPTGSILEEHIRARGHLQARLQEKLKLK
jgi:hypothetical protein